MHARRPGGHVVGEVPPPGHRAAQRVNREKTHVPLPCRGVRRPPGGTRCPSGVGCAVGHRCGVGLVDGLRRPFASVARPWLLRRRDRSRAGAVSAVEGSWRGAAATAERRGGHRPAGQQDPAPPSPRCRAARPELGAGWRRGCQVGSGTVGNARVGSGTTGPQGQAPGQGLGEVDGRAAGPRDRAAEKGRLLRRAGRQPRDVLGAGGPASRDERRCRSLPEGVPTCVGVGDSARPSLRCTRVAPPAAGAAPRGPSSRSTRQPHRSWWKAAGRRRGAGDAEVDHARPARGRAVRRRASGRGGRRPRLLGWGSAPARPRPRRRRARPPRSGPDAGTGRGSQGPGTYSMTR